MIHSLKLSMSKENRYRRDGEMFRVGGSSAASGVKRMLPASPVYLGWP